MNATMLRVLCAVGGSMLAFTAAAQIYKCEEGGRVLYSQTPCAPPDQMKEIDLGPNATVAPGAREQALQREVNRLRTDLERVQTQQQSAGSAPATGRTDADLRAEQSRSRACQEATRSYQISANSVKKADVEMRKAAMYAACGIQEPDQININIGTGRRYR